MSLMNHEMLGSSELFDLTERGWDRPMIIGGNIDPGELIKEIEAEGHEVTVRALGAVANHQPLPLPKE